MTWRVVIAGLLAAFLLAPGAQAQTPPQFTDIAGNRIAWSCRETGQPTMILIAGLGLSARETFGKVYENYDGPGRLCLYDRAGMGESRFAEPKTRTLDQLATELHDLSRSNGWGRAVLVPHSFGGFIARAYAQKHPDEVSGILFLDATQEDYLPRLKAGMSATDWAIMERLIAWNVKQFHEDYAEAQETVRGTVLSPGLPITVLSRGIPHTSVRAAGVSIPGMELFEKEHGALQARLAVLSQNAEQRIARNSSHVIGEYEPELVIEEIKRLIARLPKP